MSNRKNTVTILNAATRIDSDVVPELQATSEDWVARVTGDLGLSGVDVVVTTGYTYLAIQELAIGGYAPSASLVFVAIEPENPQFVHWRRNLPGIIAHELNHSARWVGPGCGITLLECLVSEGLATVYETELTGIEPPYARATRDFDELWEEATPLLHTIGYGHATWFFGEGHLPRWAGYGLGYELVRKHMAAERITIQEATTLPASDFLRHVGAQQIT